MTDGRDCQRIKSAIADSTRAAKPLETCTETAPDMIRTESDWKQGPPANIGEPMFGIKMDTNALRTNDLSESTIR